MTKDAGATEIERLIGLVATQQETIDYLTQYIERVESQLQDRIDEVTKQAGSTPARPSAAAAPIDWSTLSGEKRAEVWARLCDFVDLLVERHGLGNYLKPCWYRHTAAVEQLTALWGAHREAYAPLADGTMPSWWHDLLERTTVRLRRIFVKCRTEHPAGLVGAELTDAYRAERAEWIRRDEGPDTDPVSTPPALVDSPVDWSTLRGERRTRVWQELCAFVDELVHRHSLEQYVRPCWYRHPAAVEELSALWTSRKNAFGATSDGSMPSWWHDVLWAAQLRLRQVFVKCRTNHPADAAPAGAGWLDERGRAERAEWIRTEVAEH